MLFSQNAVVSYFRFIFLSPAVGKDIFFMLVDSEIFDRLEKILNMYFAFWMMEREQEWLLGTEILIGNSY